MAKSRVSPQRLIRVEDQLREGCSLLLIPHHVQIGSCLPGHPFQFPEQGNRHSASAEGASVRVPLQDGKKQLSLLLACLLTLFDRQASKQPVLACTGRHL